MNEAIKKLIENGYTEAEAMEEFSEKVNYYMRGTLHTAADRAYAVECAAADILDGLEEVTEEYIDMLEMMTA